MSPLENACQSRSSVGISLADFGLHELEELVSLCFGQAVEVEIRSPEPFPADQTNPIPILFDFLNLMPKNTFFTDESGADE